MILNKLKVTEQQYPKCIYESKIVFFRFQISIMYITYKNQKLLFLDSKVPNKVKNIKLL